MIVSCLFCSMKLDYLLNILRIIEGAGGVKRPATSLNSINSIKKIGTCSALLPQAFEHVFAKANVPNCKGKCPKLHMQMSHFKFLRIKKASSYFSEGVFLVLFLVLFFLFFIRLSCSWFNDFHLLITSIQSKKFSSGKL